MRMRETFDPIPNSAIKPHAADGTWWETARENRWLPDKIYFVNFTVISYQ